MKLLVVGGAGYVGSALVPILVEYGYVVDVIDLLWFGNKLPQETRVINKNLFHCDVSDFEGYDQVIFLAGLSNDPMANFKPAINFVSNGSLPSYLAYCAKQAGVKRFIYGSSCSVYGYTVNELYDEEAPVTCSYPYGISKLQGERGVLQLQDETFSVVALRKGTVSGRSPRMRFDLIVNTMYKCAIKEKKIVINNPSIWRPILHISDAVSAYLRAIQADYSISGVFNIASDNCTVGQVADMVKDEVEKQADFKISMEIKDIQDFRNYKVSFDKAKTFLGYEPQHNVSDIVSHLHQHKNEYGNFEDDEFYNIRVFKKLELKEQI
jgi:nucleoside-diphosphate-sugar epimerase